MRRRSRLSEREEREGLLRVYWRWLLLKWEGQSRRTTRGCAVSLRLTECSQRRERLRSALFEGTLLVNQLLYKGTEGQHPHATMERQGSYDAIAQRGSDVPCPLPATTKQLRPLNPSQIGTYMCLTVGESRREGARG